MKKLSFTKADVEACRNALIVRRASYEEALENSTDTSARKYYRKKLQQVMRTEARLTAPVTMLPSIDASHLRGCLCDEGLEEIEKTLRLLAGLTEPEVYDYCQHNFESISNACDRLRLLNSLSPRQDRRYWIPLDRYLALDIIRTTKVSYCSFSGNKPYKVALVLENDDVYRIKPDSSSAHLNGPLKMSHRELQEIYTHKLAPQELIEAFKNYERSVKLSQWESLILQLLARPEVEPIDA